MAITQLDNGYILVPRKDWGAKHSAGRKKMPKPVGEINIHHSVTSVRSDPCTNMRIVEDVLNSRGLAPGYSFCVDPSGVVLEGAGSMVGAHTAGRNSLSYGICLIGNYDQMQPTLAQLVNAARTINLLILGGAVSNNPKIQGHRATKATACPGANMVNNINGRTGIGWIEHFQRTGV